MWREELWSSHFDHPDPVHNPPSREELDALPRWSEAHAAYKSENCERALELYPEHPQALTKLAMRVVHDRVQNGGDLEGHEQAAELLRRALIRDPTSFAANLRLGWVYGHLGRYEDARRHIARALRHGAISARGLSGLADAHADWGFLEESEHLFEKALALEPGHARTLLNYARAVWDLAPHTPKETSRALALFERAFAAGADDCDSHVHFARALATIPGEHARALLHAERALALCPDDTDAREFVALLRKPLGAPDATHLSREVLPTRRFHRKTGEVIEYG